MPVLTLATFITMVQGLALGPLLPDISDELGTSVSLLGQIPAATMLVAALLGLVAGPLADRIGHHRILLVSLVTLALSAIGMALAPSYGTLFAAALVGSLGRAIVQPVATVIVGDRFDGPAQRRAVSWVMSGVSGAAVIGIPALTVVADALDWRVALGVLAVLTVVLIPPVRGGLGPDPARQPSMTGTRGILDAYRPLLAHRPTVALILASLLGSAGVWVMVTYLGAFFDERHGFSTQQIGWVYLVPGLAIFLGTVASGGRLGAMPLRPLLIACRVATGAIILVVYALSMPALAGIALLGAQGFTTAIALVAVVLLLMAESPASRATTLTLNTVALSLGFAFGSMVGGVLLAIGDFALLGIASLVFNAAAAALVWLTPVAGAHAPTGSPKRVPIWKGDPS